MEKQRPQRKTARRVAKPTMASIPTDRVHERTPLEELQILFEWEGTRPTRH